MPRRPSHPELVAKARPVARAIVPPALADALARLDEITQGGRAVVADNLVGTAPPAVVGVTDDSQILVSPGAPFTAGNLEDLLSELAAILTHGANPMTALGDTIYGGAGGDETRLAGNTTGTKKYYTQTGTGSASAAPAWAAIAAGDVPTLNQDTTGKAAKADALSTTGAAVNVSSASPPSTGDVLTATDATHATWQPPTGGSGAPASATYITQTPDATLSAEQALSALATGLMKSTTGTGVVSTVAAPSGAVVGDTDTQTLTNKTLTTPTIASFANANHTHQNSAGGGTLDAAAIAAGTVATARLGSGTANSGSFLRGDQTWQTIAGAVSGTSPADHDHTTTGDGGVLTNDAHDGYSDFVDLATPATPSATHGRLYWHYRSPAYLDEDGIETVLSPTLYSRAQRQEIANPAGTGTQNLGMGIGSTASGTPTNSDDSDGAWIKYTTGATSGNSAGRANTNYVCRPDWQAELVCRLKTGASIADVRIWVGMFTASPIGSSSPGGNYGGFRYDTGTDGTAFWRCVTDDNSGPTVTTTTAAIAATTAYTLRIRFSASRVSFWINDVLYASHTTHIPAGSTSFGWHALIATLVNSAKEFRWGRTAILTV